MNEWMMQTMKCQRVSQIVSLSMQSTEFNLVLYQLYHLFLVCVGGRCTSTQQLFNRLPVFAELCISNHHVVVSRIFIVICKVSVSRNQ